jgi:hypothetical protein
MPEWKITISYEWFDRVHGWKKWEHIPITMNSNPDFHLTPEENEEKGLIRLKYVRVINSERYDDPLNGIGHGKITYKASTPFKVWKREYGATWDGSINVNMIYEAERVI